MQELSALESLLHWIENSVVALFVRQSAWLYPAVEIVHIAGFAVLVGSIVMFDLRLLGLSRNLPVIQAMQHLSRWSRLSLIAVVPSGLILFMTDAVSLASNSAFLLKLGLIVAAGLNALYFHRVTYKTVTGWNTDTGPPAAARLAGIVSILLWFSVIACGRLIAYV
jgi:hypothetical protein